MTTTKTKPSELLEPVLVASSAKSGPTMREYFAAAALFNIYAVVRIAYGF